jgi:ferredoxin
MQKVTTDENQSVGIRDDGYTIIVDLNKCIAAGPCAIAAPGVFEIRPEDGKAIISNPDGDDLDKVLEAARCCPILAIIIKNQAGQQTFP